MFATKKEKKRKIQKKIKAIRKQGGAKLGKGDLPFSLLLISLLHVARINLQKEMEIKIKIK